MDLEKINEYCKVLARVNKNPRVVLKEYIANKRGIKGHIIPEDIEVEIDEFIALFYT